MRADDIIFAADRLSLEGAGHLGKGYRIGDPGLIALGSRCNLVSDRLREHAHKLEVAQAITAPAAGQLDLLA